MISLQRIEQQIPAITAILVLIIAGSAFCLSFYNLQLQAIEAGINPWLSWLWPVCLDCLLIAGSLMVLRSSLRQDPALVGWSVLLVFTGISTGFNVIHSPPDIVSRLAHAIPPVALCTSIELLMICIRSDMRQKPVHHAQPAQQKTAPKRGRASNAAQRIEEHYIQHPNMNMTERAAMLGLHRSMVSRHIKSIATIGGIENE